MKVSKLIHDLHEKVEKLEEDNSLLKEACKRVKKDNIDLRRNQDQDSLNRELSSAKIGNVLHERTIEDLKMENASYKKQTICVFNYQSCFVILYRKALFPYVVVNSYSICVRHLCSFLCLFRLLLSAIRITVKPFLFPFVL